MIESLNTDAKLKNLSRDEKAIQKYISRDLKPEIGDIGKNLQDQESMDNQQYREIKAINNKLGIADGYNGKINQVQNDQIA